MPKVIISCAITGSIHTPTMSPYLPITPDEIDKSKLDNVILAKDRGGNQQDDAAPQDPQ